MKIIQLSAENIKKLKAVEITPKGEVVQITGKNGSGKTSVLDSIWWALGGTSHIQGQPIRNGEAKANIKLNMGELIVTRKFTDKGSTLVVENAEGVKFSSPQKMLDDLIGELSFDPLAFAKMAASDQYNEIKRISNITLDMDALDKQNKADFDIRTNRNREAKEYAAKAEGYKFMHPEMKEIINVSALAQELVEVANFNNQIDIRATNREKMRTGIVTKKAEVERMQAEIARLQGEITADEAKLANAPALPEKKVVEDLQRQISEANDKNAEHSRRIEQKEYKRKAKEAEEKALELTNAIAARDKQKLEAIQNAKMPIAGLTLVDGKVLLNGVPFDQASDGEKIRTSVAIAMASNPKLRVIRIKDGSLLDDDMLKAIAQMAHTNDYQVWIETVNTSGKLGIYLEDGEVKAVN